MIKAQTTIWFVIAGALVTAGAAVGVAQLLNSSAPTNSGTASSNSNGQANGKNLAVGTVNVTGIVPGMSVSKALAVDNPNNQDVALASVKTAITGPTPTGACTSPSDIEVIVAGYNASTGVGPFVTIPKNTSLSLPVTVRMNNRSVNQDGCKGRTFTFTFTATATSK
ncbi:MAG: hypothetical protein ABIO67_01515 [Mycobacteriales bacterium]